MTSQVTSSLAPTAAPTEDELLGLVTRASALQQSGLTDQAIVVYAELLQADPQGRYGDLARRSLDSLGGVSPQAKAENPRSPSTTPKIPGSSLSSSPQQPLSGVQRWRSNPMRLMNLPIRQKQLLGLFTSELVSILGLVGVGAVLIVTGLRSQLVEQTKSEVAVADINYNIKIDQMGFGFRGQSDNTAIIGAAISGKSTPQVVAILKNEIQARNIEYATLVNNQARIIASANSNRSGQLFNPNDLVTTALASGEQLTATEVISWAELAQEKAPLPEGVQDQDALIRYTITPVRNPANQAVLGALVSGDIVNGKQAMVERTLAAFGGGYSAVYFRNTSDEWQLATALQDQQGTLQPNIPLPDLTLLDLAVKTPGDRVEERLTIGGTPYTAVAQAVANSQGQPTAVLVRGTAETGVNSLLRTSLTWQATSVVVVILLDLWIATLLTRSIAGPMVRLQESAQKLAAGDNSSRADVLTTDEVGNLAQTFNLMADSIQARTDEVEALARQRQQEAEDQRKQTEKLQQRVIGLLLEIEGAQTGDLTVRAQVTDDEMGSVADAFNATVRSLRQLVTQVQQVSQQMNYSATDSDRSVTELSSQALQQAESIATVLRSVEEMSQSIESVANSALAAAAIAKKASLSASAGGTAMEQTVNSIEDLRGSVAETTKKVKRLTESSQEISKIVALISEISSKTNLLAFNASIEAVRAGENGQGFRIVADEVRRLAERVSESTKEIEQLVSSIQVETAEVLSMMEKGTTQVVTSTRMMTDTRQTLLALVDTNQEIDQLVQKISESTASQSVASQQVSQTMKEVAEVALSTSTGSQQVSQSLKQLLEVSAELQESVSQFKVDTPT